MEAEGVQVGGQICREDTPSWPRWISVGQGRQEFWLQQVHVPKFRGAPDVIVEPVDRQAAQEAFSTNPPRQEVA